MFVRLTCWNIGMLVGAIFVISEPAQLVKAVYRFVVSFGVALFIGIDYKLNGGEQATDEDMNRLHQRSALRLLGLFEHNKGIFIKFGQHLAALDYLLPEEYTTVMQRLQNHAPTCEFSEIDKVFKQELGKSAHDMYDFKFPLLFHNFLIIIFFSIDFLNLKKLQLPQLL